MRRLGSQIAMAVYLLQNPQYQICNCGVLFNHACRHSTCIEPTWDHGGQHGQESEEGNGEEEDREEEGKEEVGPSLHTICSETHQGARGPVTGKTEIAAA